MSLELRNVSKRVGADVHIHETSLSLTPGIFNVLLGATKAGKTTLIKMMAGLDQPSEGSVWLNGEDVTRTSPRDRNISLVHQFFVNYPHLSVFENIASPLRVSGMPSSEIAGRVEEAADILQLGPMLNRRPQTLSGGQQQRTALARAIVKESRAVFLDEPLANLDYKLREELRDQLPELFAGRGAVVVYATSEPSEALLLGGRTALIHQGHVTQFGPTAEIYRKPANLLSAQVMSDPPINVTMATKQGNRIQLGDGVSWPASGNAAQLSDGRYIMAIRPHFVSSVDTGGSAISVTGTVQITELSGSESVAHFALGDDVWVSLTPGVHPYNVGDKHAFYLNVEECMYFAADGSLAASGTA